MRVREKDKRTIGVSKTMKCDKCGNKKIEVETFPKVFKYTRSDGTKLLSVVYSNRVEDYEFKKSTSGKQIQQSNEQEEEWNPYNEIRMMLDSGFKNVRENKYTIHSCPALRNLADMTLRGVSIPQNSHISVTNPEPEAKTIIKEVSQ